MSNKFYTVMVMSGKSSKFRKFTVPKVAMKVCGGIGCILTILLSVFAYNYYVMWERLSSVGDISPTKKIVITKVDDSSLNRFNHTLSTIRRDLQNLEKNSSKFRVMMGLQQSVSAQHVSGVGGTDDPFKRAKFLSGDTLMEEILKDVKTMKFSISKQKGGMSELLEVMEEKRDLLASTPSLWPTKGWVTSGFGVRTSPFTGKREFHRGLDISAPRGSIVEAPADGIVTFSGMKGSLGNAVEINHGFGIYTCYGHNSKLLVHEGQRVVRGQPISRVGSTGRSTGPHLHYEIRIAGVRVNPRNYILN